MKDYEKIAEALTHCGHDMLCEDCPYKAVSDCTRQLNDDAVRLIEELVDRLEQPKTTATDVIIPNYESENRKLNDKLCEAEIALERYQRECAEAQRELAYLRAVKATAEAFLGRKINGQM